jgi:ATP-dependent Clp protease ATP-binding subunit ClpA
MHVSDEALEMIVSKGYSLAFGARFLKRVIDECVKLPISAQWKNGSHFEVSVKDSALVVEPAAASNTAAMVA